MCINIIREMRTRRFLAVFPPPTLSKGGRQDMKRVKKKDIPILQYIRTYMPEMSLTDIEDQTGYTREQLRKVIPIEEMEQKEQDEMREVLRAHGYTV